MSPRKLASLGALAVVVALSGCAGDGDEEAEPESVPTNLAALVLQPEDLPKVFIRFDEGKLNIADYHAGPRQSRTRFGRQGGWKARYRRAGNLQTAGPLVIDSQVDRFSDEDGAEQDIEAYEQELRSPWRELEDPELGDEAVAVTQRQGSGKFAQRYFTVAWREGRMTASLGVQGFEGKLTLADVLSLARKQQAHLQQS